MLEEFSAIGPTPVAAEPSRESPTGCLAC